MLLIVRGHDRAMRPVAWLRASVPLLTLALGVVVGGVAARAYWAVPCLTRFDEYASVCERRVATQEARENVLWLARAAAAYAREHRRMPPAAPRTPRDVPRGRRVETPDAAWDAPGWVALHFEPSTKTQRFSYELVTTEQSFAARAYGDLNGDGRTSLFERSGEIDAAGHVTEQAGVFIELELE